MATRMTHLMDTHKLVREKAPPEAVRIFLDRTSGMFDVSQIQHGSDIKTLHKAVRTYAFSCYWQGVLDGAEAAKHIPGASDTTSEGVSK